MKTEAEIRAAMVLINRANHLLASMNEADALLASITALNALRWVIAESERMDKVLQSAQAMLGDVPPTGNPHEN